MVFFAAELARYDARKHIQLVLRRDGDEQVASSTFASRWTDIIPPLPQRVMTSSVSDRSFTFSFSISTTVISWFSLASSLGKRIAYLACADYYDLHFQILSIYLF